MLLVWIWWLPLELSVMGLPDGARRYDATGQLFEAKNGQWIRCLPGAPELTKPLPPKPTEMPEAGNSSPLATKSDGMPAPCGIDGIVDLHCIGDHVTLLLNRWTPGRLP
jgi:hypothetical protein